MPKVRLFILKALPLPLMLLARLGLCGPAGDQPTTFEDFLGRLVLIQHRVRVMPDPRNSGPAQVPRTVSVSSTYDVLREDHGRVFSASTYGTDPALWDLYRLDLMDGRRSTIRYSQGGALLGPRAGAGPRVVNPAVQRKDVLAGPLLLDRQHDVKDGRLIVKVDRSWDGYTTEDRMKVTLAPDFARHRFVLEPPRRDDGVPCLHFNAFPESVRRLADGVAQIISSVHVPDDQRGGMSDTSYATAFFLTSDGLLWTDRHVIDSFDESCREKLACRMIFRQVRSDGSRQEFTAPVRILAYSLGYDFALLRADFSKAHHRRIFRNGVKEPRPSQILPISPIPIEHGSRIGPREDVLSYPGGQLEDIGDGRRRTPATLSQGSLEGFLGQTFVVSAVTDKGSSGAPVVNQGSDKAIGIVYQKFVEGTSDQPVSLVMPLATINRRFGIEDYIPDKPGGRSPKELRVDQIMQSLWLICLPKEGADPSRPLQCPHLARVRELIRQYEDERTLLGTGELQKLMIYHPDPGVRWLVLQALIQGDIIRGNP